MRGADRRKAVLGVLMGLVLLSGCGSDELASDDDGWVLVFSDSGSDHWKDHWFLEGLKGSVVNGERGMVFSAGPVPREHASHAVLWTKKSFDGDLKIEYDYTRLDESDVTAVNILYIQATGTGAEDSPKDIALSTSDRQEPWMKYYFLKMNALHISYATSEGYVSARRYPAKTSKEFSKGTQILPVFEGLDLFKPGETWHITAEKRGKMLSFVAERGGRVHRFEWNYGSFGEIESGRVGLRHMWTRSSRYEDFRIYQRQPESPSQGRPSSPSEGG